VGRGVTSGTSGIAKRDRIEIWGFQLTRREGAVAPFAGLKRTDSADSSTPEKKKKTILFVLCDFGKGPPDIQGLL